jgi:hypothetical protein
MAEDKEPLLTPLQREYLARNPEASLVDQSTNMPGAPIRGVGGWLGLLTASLLVLGPLLNAGLIANELEIYQAGQPLSEHPSSVALMVWAYFAFYAILSVFAGYRLSKHFNPATIPIVLTCIWLPIVLECGLMFVSVSPDAAIFRSILWASIWTAYLLRSKRVKNTYCPSRA